MFVRLYIINFLTVNCLLTSSPSQLFTVTVHRHRKDLTGEESALLLVAYYQYTTSSIAVCLTVNWRKENNSNQWQLNPVTSYGDGDHYRYNLPKPKCTVTTCQQRTKTKLGTVLRWAGTKKSFLLERFKKAKERTTRMHFTAMKEREREREK